MFYLPTPANLLIVATLLPLVGFVVLLSVGKRMGSPLAGWLGTVFIALSFILTMVAMVSWFGVDPGHFQGSEFGKGIGPINFTFRWLPIGLAENSYGVGQDHPGYLDLGIYIDSLSITMCAMVTLVATAVHVFSIGYLRREPNFGRYFAYLSLFCFSMLGLVLGGTLLHIFIFWELVGFCSYLLIGFWHQKPTAVNAAIKAFVVNRIGDTGFLIGMGLIAWKLGNVSLADLWTYLGGAGSGHGVPLPGGYFPSRLLTFTGIALFSGAIGKSAQFPLHTWLADAMEGPTPVSALIHAATMVAAGVYLVARIFPILTPNAKLFMAIIGVITLTMGALIAVAQTDIKRLLAFSTMSQLGYMILAISIGSWVGGLFHLFTHAFFKALLFLGAGSVIQAAHHEQEMLQLGGLARKIPLTAISFAIGVLAISGAPFLSGYYSKTIVLDHAAAFWSLANSRGRSGAYLMLFALPAVVAYLTPFYMTRCWMLTFWGRPRNERVHRRAREFPLMIFPLFGLAFMCLVSGRYLSIQQLLDSSIRETQAVCRDTRARDSFFHGREDLSELRRVWPTEVDDASAVGPKVDVLPDDTEAANALRHGRELEHKWTAWAWLIGIGAAFFLFLPGDRIVRSIAAVQPIGWLRAWLYHRMFFDELYFGVFVGTATGLAQLTLRVEKWVVDGAVNSSGTAARRLARFARWIDGAVFDGTVSGIAAFSRDAGAVVRMPQSGRIRAYVMLLAMTAAAGVATVVIVLLSH